MHMSDTIDFNTAIHKGTIHEGTIHHSKHAPSTDPCRAPDISILRGPAVPRRRRRHAPPLLEPVRAGPSHHSVWRQLARGGQRYLDAAALGGVWGGGVEKLLYICVGDRHAPS